jgi:hypothetical protein
VPILDRSSRWPLIFALVLTVSCRSHTAPINVGPGSKVRLRADVTQPTGGVRGVLASSDRDSIRVVLAPGSSPNRPNDTVSFARNSLMWIETPHGAGRNGKKGMWMGLASGAVASASVAAATHHPCKNCFFPTTTTQAATTAGIVGGIGGMLIGGVVGKLIVTER